MGVSAPIARLGWDRIFDEGRGVLSYSLIPSTPKQKKNPPAWVRSRPVVALHRATPALVIDSAKCEPANTSLCVKILRGVCKYTA